ncbi:hypothetical protein JCM5296_004490 [Sporobolomyces johnsonii]
MASPPPLERTLAVLFAPEGPAHREAVQKLVLEAGFAIAAEDSLSGEELEEAGLDLGLGVGEEGVTNENKEGELVHTVWVLERKSAVNGLKELKTNDIASTFSDVRVFAAPSASAAAMAIDVLFPSLDAITSPTPVAILPNGHDTSPTPAPPAETVKPKPFALSNLAWEAPTSTSSPFSTRTLSPSIEKALEELEAREERRRASNGTSNRSSGSTSSTPRVESRGSGSRIASNLSEGEFTDEEEEVQERRVFTTHSREPTEEYDVYPPEDTATYEVEDGLDGEEVTGLEESDMVAREGAPSISASESSPSLSPPPLKSVSSSISSTSTKSSTPASATSFRARPAPAAPSAQPRMTKAAALRLGIPLPPTTPRQRSSSSVETTSSLASATPRAVPAPRSLAAPSIAPRSTKSSALRAGQDAASSNAQTPRPVKRQSISTSERAAMDRLTRRHSVQVPSLTAEPTVAVRMSKTALLRAGMELPPTTPKARSRQSSVASFSSTSSAAASDAVLDDAAAKKARRATVSASLKSLREPAVAPRSTKASALRSGTPIESPSMSRGRSLGTLEDLVEEMQSSRPSGFEGIPGHKRRESIQVKATLPPKVEVRMSRAARLRNGDAVESPVMRRTQTEPVSFEGVPGHKRRESVPVASLSKPPSVTPRLNRAVLLRQGSSDSTIVSPLVTRRPASALASLPPRAPSAVSSRSSAVAAPTRSPKKPSIAPRLNKAAELRATKKSAAEKEQAPLSGAIKTKKTRPAGPALALAKRGPARPATSLGLATAFGEVTNSSSTSTNCIRP